MQRLSLPRAARDLDRHVLAARGAKQAVDAYRAYGQFVELERTAVGKIESVATLLLTNRECPLRCTMCDLWKHTLDQDTPVGAIPQQIEEALAGLPWAPHIKLYNSGNFFDPRAIPREDHPAIAGLLQRHETVIVENHPRFTGAMCGEFAGRLPGQFEVAIGLETTHPETLAALNKRMRLSDFDTACEQLLQDGIRVRAFLLLKPPGMDEQEGIEWALRSIEYCLSRGVTACSVIPTRAGNGLLDQLQRQGEFAPPKLSSLEQVLEESLPEARGRVFVDLWDAEQFARCSLCVADRLKRLTQMNLEQRVLPRVDCAACEKNT